MENSLQETVLIKEELLDLELTTEPLKLVKDPLCKEQIHANDVNVASKQADLATDLAVEVWQRFKDPFGRLGITFKEDKKEIANFKKLPRIVGQRMNTKEKHLRKTAIRQARLATQTKEETEVRLLRCSLIRKKNELLRLLELPEKFANEKSRNALKKRLRRQKLRAQESPEEAIARKKHQCEQIKKVRNICMVLETPTQTFNRLEKQRMLARKHRESETPEQRAARLTAIRNYQRERKRKNRPILSARTGRMRGKRKTETTSNEAEKIALERSVVVELL